MVTGVAGTAGVAGLTGAAPGTARPAVVTGPVGAAVAPGTAERAARAEGGWAAGIGLMTGAAASAQLGAAIAAQAFPVLGPVGVVAIRQWVASGVMLASVRPKVGEFTARQWRPVLLPALVFTL